MSISTELDKSKKAKTAIRKSIQRKGTGLTLAELFTEYHKYIKNMSDTRVVDVTGLKDYAENRCYSLEIKVNRIRPYAFRNYTCLQQLYLNTDSVVVLEDINAFYGTDTEILVPNNLVNAYKIANNWKNLSDRIKAYTSRTEENMFILQHINHVQTTHWLQTKKLAELEKDFRI